MIPEPRHSVGGTGQEERRGKDNNSLGQGKFCKGPDVLCLRTDHEHPPAELAVVQPHCDTYSSWFPLLLLS